MKSFYISYDHSKGAGVRKVSAATEQSAIIKCRARVERSALDSDPRNYRSVTRAQAKKIAKIQNARLNKIDANGTA